MLLHPLWLRSGPDQACMELQSLSPGHLSLPSRQPLRLLALRAHPSPLCPRSAQGQWPRPSRGNLPGFPWSRRLAQGEHAQHPAPGAAQCLVGGPGPCAWPPPSRTPLSPPHLQRAWPGMVPGDGQQGPGCLCPLGRVQDLLGCARVWGPWRLQARPKVSQGSCLPAWEAGRVCEFVMPHPAWLGPGSFPDTG